MVSLVCPVQAISPWRDVWLIVEQPFSGGPEGAAPDGRPRRLDSGTAPSSAAGAQGADNSGRFVEFELAIQVGRGDGWSSGWLADGVQERLYGRRLREGGDHLHPTRASGADGDVVLKDPSQKLGPGNAMNTAPSGVGVLTTFGLRQDTGTRAHNLRSASGHWDPVRSGPDQARLAPAPHGIAPG